MESEQTIRAALGHLASLGDLYDAKTDSFCGTSLLKTNIPASALTSMDNFAAKMDVISSDLLSATSEKLGISREQMASAHVGLVKLDGLGCWLQDNWKNPKDVRSSLLYNICTKVELLDIFAEELRDCICSSALRDSENATHVVCQVEWGANCMVCLDYKNDEKLDAAKIQKEICAELDKLSICLREGTQFHEGQNSIKFKNLSLKIFSDVFTGYNSEPKNFEEALLYMKMMPDLITTYNDGKGQPLNYTLMPLPIIENFLYDSTTVDRWVNPLDVDTVNQILDFFQKIVTVNKELNDMHTDFKINSVCFKQSQIEEVNTFVSNWNLGIANLRSELGTILVEIRSGQKHEQELKSLIQSFNKSNISTEKITAFIDGNVDKHEKIEFTKFLKKENIGYIGNGNSIDIECRKLFNSDIYVFFYREHFDDKMFAECKRFLYEFVDESPTSTSLSVDNKIQRKNRSFLVVDLDVCPELIASEGVPNGVRISLFRNGKYIIDDVIMQMQIEKKMYRVQTTCEKKAVDQKPNKLLEVELFCPSYLLGNCPADKRKWKCNSCNVHIEFGIEDRHFYCLCGRAPIEAYAYRCGSSAHADEYISFDEKVINGLVQDFILMKEINILILGETGVGKSTWINGITNYITFQSIHEAKLANPVYLIPTSFILTDEHYEEKKIEIGEAINETFSTNGQSATQEPFAHVVKTGNLKIRLIDTPGIGDTRGIQQDKENFDKILRFLSGLHELHGICILLKPNNSRLTVMFRFCITELLTHLHRTAANNIIFCFTNARGTLYRPGDTLPPLKFLLEKFKKEQGVEIPCSNHTMYCLDNEAFRFLCALHCNVKFEEEDVNNFAKSWERSVAETNRMLDHISKLQPHQITETVSLNDARNIIVNLTKPLADMSTNIDININALNQNMKRLTAHNAERGNLKKKVFIPQIQLVAKQLGYPRTVCANASCIRTQTVPGTSQCQTVYKTVCHDPCHLKCVIPEQYPNPDLQKCGAMDELSILCRNCGCSWEFHLHITYEYDQLSVNIPDPTIQDLLQKGASRKAVIERAIQVSTTEIAALQSEREAITKISVKFGSFLKTNAIVPYNDAFDEYIRFLINKERGIVSAGGDDANLISLETMQSMYREQVLVLNAAMMDHSIEISTEDVYRLKSELMSLPKKGKELQAILDVATASRSSMMHYNESCYTPNTNHQKPKMKIKC